MTPMDKQLDLGLDDPVLGPNPLTHFEGHLKFEVVKYAVGRAIFCPTKAVCGGKLLDARNAVHLSNKPGEKPEFSAIACGECFDELLRRGEEKLGEPYTAAVLEQRGIDVYDGRVLKEFA